MNCPKCHLTLQRRTDRGVDVELCPRCGGMWLTPAELNELEDTAFDEPDDAKGSLYVTTHDTELLCPVCAAHLRRFNYRFYDLQLDVCAEHGYWLDKGEDERIVELMLQEEKRDRHALTAEARWVKHVKRLRSHSFFSKLRDRFR